MPPAPRTLQHVEHRVDAAVLHVHPDRVHVLHAARRRVVRGHDVDVVGDRHLERPRGEVVDHVVDPPEIVRRVAVAVARRHVELGLLLADAEEPLRKQRGGVEARARQPDAVVQVDLVDRRNGTVGEAQVRFEPHDPTVDLRLRDRDLVRLDHVLAGPDVEGAELEVQVLHRALGRWCVTGVRGNRRREDCETDDARDGDGPRGLVHAVTVPEAETSGAARHSAIDGSPRSCT